MSYEKHKEGSGLQCTKFCDNSHLFLLVQMPFCLDEDEKVNCRFWEQNNPPSLFPPGVSSIYPQAHSFPLASTSPLNKSIPAPDEEKNELPKHKGHCKPDLSSDRSVKAQERRQRCRGNHLGLDRASLWGLLSAERTDLQNWTG